MVANTAQVGAEITNESVAVTVGNNSLAFLAKGRTIVAAGVLDHGTAATPLPTHTGNLLVLLRPLTDNAGEVSIGDSDLGTNGGPALPAGGDYLPLADTSDLYLIGTDAGDSTGYLILE